MVGMMSAAEQVDREFTSARRRARLHGLVRRLRGMPGTGRLLSFEEARRKAGAYGGFRRGRSTVETRRIVGSSGKHDQFDDRFMPLRGASPGRWERIDLAYRSVVELPPASLCRLDDDYFVEDVHHRVSVAWFHGAEWMDAEVMEFRSSRDLATGWNQGSTAAPSCAWFSPPALAALSETRREVHGKAVHVGGRQPHPTGIPGARYPDEAVPALPRVGEKRRGGLFYRVENLPGRGS